MSSFIERRQRVKDINGPLMFLELSAPSFPDILRLVNDNKDWNINGQTYIGLPFRLKLPQDTSGNTPNMQLEIDNVGRNMTEELENLQPGEIITAVVMLSDRAEPGSFYRRYPMPITRVTVNSKVATATAGMSYIMRQQAVRLRANNFTLPGIFS